MMNFKFGEFTTRTIIGNEIPAYEKIAQELGGGDFKTLIIADKNTFGIAEKISAGLKLPHCIIKNGEKNKNFDSVRVILSAAHEAGFDRNDVFLAIGGGSVSDLAGFAASIYKRGCRLVIVPTTLLSMVDASVGGKTGFDLFGIKNLAGTFYPAEIVYMPMDCLLTLPAKEWKNGLAELIKTAILAGDDYIEDLASSWQKDITSVPPDVVKKSIERAVLFKAGIISEDLREKGRRMLLNLGHTFGHALEATAGCSHGPGKISHGEAVAWGIARACDLALTLEICPQKRVSRIKELLDYYGYETAPCHPLIGTAEEFLQALSGDKKKRGVNQIFIVPDEISAKSVTADTNIIKKIISKK